MACDSLILNLVILISNYECTYDLLQGWGEDDASRPNERGVFAIA